MVRCSVLLLALLAAAPLSVSAQSKDRSVGDDLKDVGSDFAFLARSPLHMGSADAVTAGLVAAGFVALLPADRPIYAWTQSHPGFTRPIAKVFGEKSPVNLLGSTGKFLLPLSIILYGSGVAFDSDDLRDAGLGCFTSNVFTSLTHTVVAKVVSRPRPNLGRSPWEFGVPGGPWEEHSFYGGHAANVLSCATFLNHRFHMGIAEPVLYGVSVGVGVARVVDGEHWPSDTFAGMAYGYALGRSVAARWSERDRRRAELPPVVVAYQIRF